MSKVIKTQMQIYEEVRKNIAGGNELFMEMIKDKENPMTNNDLRALVARRPDKWGRFKGFIGKLKD